MPAHLTETAIIAATKRAAEQHKRITLADTNDTKENKRVLSAAERGLQLRITPNGKRTWVLYCRDSNGKPRRFMLGQYPEIGLAQARRSASAMRELVRKGADPIAEARQKRAEAKIQREVPADTLGALLGLYELQRGTRLRTWSKYKRQIANVFAKQLDTALGDLRLGTLQMQADRWPKRHSAAAAVRYLRPILKWAAAPGRAYVSKELTEITPPAAIARRERVLSRYELAKLLPSLTALDDGYARAMRFMLLTMARREEVAGARWGECDLQRAEWTIEKERNKSGRRHVVSLSRQALALLRAIRPEKAGPESLIFTTGNGGALQRWDPMTKRLLIAAGLAKKDEKIGKVVMRDGSQLPTRHDLRRTGATMLGELGVEPHVIEAALNHAHIGGQLPSLYNRSRYRAPVADALQLLADALDGIVTGAAVVVPLRAT